MHRLIDLLIKVLIVHLNVMERHLKELDHEDYMRGFADGVFWCRELDKHKHPD